MVNGRALEGVVNRPVLGDLGILRFAGVFKGPTEEDPHYTLWIAKHV